MGHGGVARVVLGLALTLALAILVAHPRIRRLTDRVGLHAVASTGFPFLLLGAFFHLDAIGILGPTVLRHLQPAFEFGLGWIGFAVGMQFDLHALDRLPKGVGNAVAVQSLVPMILVAIFCGATLLALRVFPNEGLFRAVIVLAACAAASAPTSGSSLIFEAHGALAAELLHDLTTLDEVVALALLGLVSVYFRPSGVEAYWQLPKSAWLLVALGVGALLGIVAFILLRGARKASERIALLLGAVAFAAGMAGYLALSVPVICAMAGAMLANLPVPDKAGLRRMLIDFERPLYLVFLVIVGASWDPTAWQGWCLAAAFAIPRLYGKLLGARAAVKILPALPPVPVVAGVLMSQSPISVVVIIAATLEYGPVVPSRVRWMINAVIVSAVLTEVMVFALARRAPNLVVEQPVAT